MSSLSGWVGPAFCWIMAVAAHAQLVREANTTIQLPAALPAVSGYTTENALGSLMFDFPMVAASVRQETHRLFVAERNGALKVVTNLDSTPAASVYLNLSQVLASGETFRMDGENGFLSLAFHPGFSSNRTLYVYYSLGVSESGGGKLFQRLHRIVVNDATSDSPSIESHEALLTIVDRATNHNGGTLDFGPDGYLYLSLGDEGGAGDTHNNARFIDQRYDPQNGVYRSGFWGQMLRLDVDFRPGNVAPQAHQQNSATFPSAVHEGTYLVPADNPFTGLTSWHGEPVLPERIRTEIWATGLRNPFRWSFDRPTERLFLGDVGQGAYEEINLMTAGGDYGWSWREGTHPYGNPPPPVSPPETGFLPVEPIYDYGRSNNGVLSGNSVTGGAVYRGNRLTELYGDYVFADYGSGAIVALRESGGVWTARRLATEGGIVHFGHDPRNGDLIFCDVDGRVRRLVRSGSAGEAPPATLSAAGVFSDLSSLTTHPGIVPYDVNVPFWSDHAVKRRWFSIPDPTDRVTFSRDGNWSLPAGMVWIKHFDFETVRGDPLSAKKLETRLLVKTDDGTYGLSYRWRDDQSDADLVDEGGLDDPLPVMVDGVPATQTWRFPSRGECLTCHTPAGGHALSFNTRQLSRERLYGMETLHQIAAFDGAGYFSAPVGAPRTLPGYAAGNDESQSLEWRVRSYFAVNCSQCHQPGGPATGNWDARATVELDEANIIHGALLSGSGDPANRFAVPGDPGRSVVLHRLLGMPSRMPPVGSNVTDEAAVELLTRWIQQDLPGRRSFAQWQVEHFGENPPAEAAADQDPDGDGLSNRLEYLAGTDPRAGNSPSLLDFVISGQNLRFRHQLPANRAVVIETSPDLSPGSWLPWDVPGNSPVFSATGGERTMDFPRPEDGVRFFRARISSP